jgi:hypothetical protein
MSASTNGIGPFARKKIQACTTNSQFSSPIREHVMAKRILTKSLRTVVQRAFEDEAFHKALVSNTEKALKKAGIRLSKKDMRKLKGFLGMRSLAKDFEVYKNIGYQFERKLGFLPW